MAARIPDLDETSDPEGTSVFAAVLRSRVQAVPPEAVPQEVRDFLARHPVDDE